MNTRRVGYLVAAGAAALAIAATNGSGIQAAGQSATYEVIFVPSWNPESNPADYPITHGKKGLLTPIIGATHGANYSLFADGKRPSPGLERLSEMGAHDPLDAEIKKAIADGTAGSLIEASEGSAGPVHPVVMHTFRVDRNYPIVSLVGMIAPSPDWFYGVSDVKLFDKGRWAPSVRVDAFARDSGGDAGTTYMAEDADTNPKTPTMVLDNDYFNENAPVGTFIFKLVPSSTES